MIVIADSTPLNNLILIDPRWPLKGPTTWSTSCTGLPTKSAKSSKELDPIADTLSDFSTLIIAAATAYVVVTVFLWRATKESADAAKASARSRSTETPATPCRGAIL